MITKVIPGKTILRIKSPAKLNLYLNIKGRRSDGYHQIETIFERIDLCDELTMELVPEDGDIVISCNWPQVPVDEKNLAYRAAGLIKEKYNLDYRIKIDIRKNIPLASGLGGGSSNAACVLLGLIEMLKLNIGKNDLISMARQLGSDVPFFVLKENFAFGKERGDELKPIFGHFSLWHLIIVPDFGISSSLAYSWWDLYRLQESLTKTELNVKLLIYALKENDLAGLSKMMHNSLEEVVLRSRSQARKIKEKLDSLGIKNSLMSGSGPAFFVLTKDRREAMELRDRLSSEIAGCKIILARTYPSLLTD
jgi:4-diphosphocytidyl-2-C-methyl-D-erythritol kinase